MEKNTKTRLGYFIFVVNSTCQLFISQTKKRRQGPLTKASSPTNQVKCLLSILHGKKLIPLSNNMRFISMTSKKMSF